MGPPVSSPTLKPHPKKPMKGTRGISWGPLLTPGPRTVPKFPMVSPPLIQVNGCTVRIALTYIPVAPRGSTSAPLHILMIPERWKCWRW
ncbi:unnamed protein product, partial [Staurois parvus]